MITIQNLTHIYPGGRHQAPRRALDNLTLTIAEGEFFVLFGPNGGGKSTLFRILTGLLQPSGGRVQIQGIDWQEHSQEVRRLMGVVFQKPALDKHLSVMENLRIHAELYAIPEKVFRANLEESLRWSGLSDRLADRVETLSGGLARQAELLKALLHHPRLLLMDEPTTGLDPGVRYAFMRNLRRIQAERGMTVLMTSHLFAEAEEADSMAILQQGRLLARDTPKNLREALGREMLIIQTEAVAEVAAVLAGRAGITLQQHPSELRVEGGDAVALMEELLTSQRGRIRSLAVKQPTLEDVYIRITGHGLDEETA